MALDQTAKTQIIYDLYHKGYIGDLLWSMTDEELLAAAQYESEAQADYLKSNRDRANTNIDFKNQLAQLTSSKQKQAEQAGRISNNVARTEGLAAMMSNF